MFLQMVYTLSIIGVAVFVVGIMVRLFPMGNLSLKFRIYTSYGFLFIAFSLFAFVLWLYTSSLFAIFLEIVVWMFSGITVRKRIVTNSETKKIITRTSNK